MVAALLVLTLVAGACSKHSAKNPATSVTQPDRTSTTLVARPAGYVALGDSYTAGGGAPPYDLDLSCARSSKGYPSALDAADDQVHLVADLACGGAKLDQLIHPWPAHGLPAQIPATPDPDVGLVTLTAGGNDASLVQVIAACAQLDCSDVVGSAAADAKLSEVTATLADDVYPALRKAYPNARLVQISYPYLTSTRLGQTCSWLSSDEERVPNQAVSSVNDAIHDATRQDGQVEFLDLSRVFRGHELCSDQPWINAVDAGLSALHPNAAGYVALGQAIAKALQG
jgi:lysophospholipase L1-like esterase